MKKLLLIILALTLALCSCGGKDAENEKEEKEPIKEKTPIFTGSPAVVEFKEIMADLTEVTPDSEFVITEAEKAYEKLSYKEKTEADVASLYEKLTKAREEYDSLLNEVDEINKSINSLKDVHIFHVDSEYINTLERCESLFEKHPSARAYIEDENYIFLKDKVALINRDGILKEFIKSHGEHITEGYGNDFYKEEYVFSWSDIIEKGEDDYKITITLKTVYDETTRIELLIAAYSENHDILHSFAFSNIKLDDKLDEFKYSKTQNNERGDSELGYIVYSEEDSTCKMHLDSKNSEEFNIVSNLVINFLKEKGDEMFKKYGSDFSFASYGIK